jgi:hypothetical protein
VKRCRLGPVAVAIDMGGVSLPGGRKKGLLFQEDPLILLHLRLCESHDSGGAYTPFGIEGH